MQSLKNTFGKEERLKSRKEIDFLFKEGKVFREGPLKVKFFYFKGDESAFPVKMGVTVPAKVHPRAVDRNLIKRLVREAYRRNKKELLQQVSSSGLNLHFMVIYSKGKIPGYAEIEDKIILILNRLISLKKD